MYRFELFLTLMGTFTAVLVFGSLTHQFESIFGYRRVS
jgi:hypothetical protein